MSLFDLTGKVCIVTGGNGGIGLAYAKGLLKAGAQVAIWGRNAEKNETALQALDVSSEKAAAFIADLTDEKQAKAAFEATLAHFGKVDVCFANAGGAGKQGPFHKWSTEEWQQILDLNLNSVVHTYKLVIAHLIDRGAPGKLIVTSSIAALMGTGYATGYGTTKAAVMGLTRSLAVELGRKDIQVNAILPGFVETEMSVQTPAAFKEGVHRRAASGKLGTLDQLEGVAVFLASRHSDFMTGQGIILDGGHSIFPM